MLKLLYTQNPLHNAEAQHFWMRKGKSDNRGNANICFMCTLYVLCVPFVHASTSHFFEKVRLFIFYRQKQLYAEASPKSNLNFGKFFLTLPLQTKSG